MIRMMLMVTVLGMLTMTDLRANEGSWFTDYATAKAAAQEQQKPMLLNFTGSDWCGWCMKLEKEVFSTPAFKNYAREHLILVKIDFPKHKALPDPEKEQNDTLAAKYQVKGYPTLVLISPEEQILLSQEGYDGPPQPFIDKLDAAIKK